jgi:hypothetical protein
MDGMRTPFQASNSGLINSGSGEPISKRDRLVDDHLLTILTLKFYQFFENVCFLQYEQLLTP